MLKPVLLGSLIVFAALPAAGQNQRDLTPSISRAPAANARQQNRDEKNRYSKKARPAPQSYGQATGSTIGPRTTQGLAQDAINRASR